MQGKVCFELDCSLINWVIHCLFGTKYHIIKMIDGNYCLAFFLQMFNFNSLCNHSNIFVIFVCGCSTSSHEGSNALSLYLIKLEAQMAATGTIFSQFPNCSIEMEFSQSFAFYKQRHPLWLFRQPKKKEDGVGWLVCCSQPRYGN